MVNGILIAGGYGVVGSLIAADLAADFRVVIAGRNLVRANAVAAAIGHGVSGRKIDVLDNDSIATALSDIELVVSCIDQPRRGLLHAALKRGIAYTDITPHLVALGRGAAYESIDEAAKASGARVVLGTGIVPGISNVMVRALATDLGGVDRIETSLLLTAGDVAGPASFEYLGDELTMRFAVHVDGTDRPARPFTDPEPIEFPAPFGRRLAYLFPFSDQVLYPRTVGATTVTTRLAINPPLVASLLATLVRTNAARLLRSRMARRIAARRSASQPSRDQHEQFALRVDVYRDNQRGTLGLVGPAQAAGAAAGASATVRALLHGEASEPGAWMPEQVLAPATFFQHLAKCQLVVRRANAGDFDTVA